VVVKFGNLASRMHRNWSRQPSETLQKEPRAPGSVDVQKLPSEADPGSGVVELGTQYRSVWQVLLSQSAPPKPGTEQVVTVVGPFAQQPEPTGH
jgi:hypothetical protein